MKALEDFWRYPIETGLREKFEMIWLIGFRGKSDVPFWQTFPDGPEDEAGRARVIEEMMAREVALLKATTGNPAPLMRITLYNENSDFLARGLLHPPADPHAHLGICRGPARPLSGGGYSQLSQRCPAAGRLLPELSVHLKRRSSGPGRRAVEDGAELPDGECHQRPAPGILRGERRKHSRVSAGAFRQCAHDVDFEEYRTGAFLRDFCAQYFGPANAETHRRSLSRLLQQGFDRQYVFQDMRYARALEQILPALLASLRGILHEAEHDRFTGWYDGDRLFGLDKLKQRIETAIRELS